MAEEMRIEVPAEKTLGVHADFASVWHTPETVVIDFLSISQPIQQGEDGDQVINASLASRVRIPPTHVFELMKALEQQLAAWEVETGRRRPE